MPSHSLYLYPKPHLLINYLSLSLPFFLYIFLTLPPPTHTFQPSVHLCVPQSYRRAEELTLINYLPLSLSFCMSFLRYPPPSLYFHKLTVEQRNQPSEPSPTLPLSTDPASSSTSSALRGRANASPNPDAGHLLSQLVSIFLPRSFCHYPLQIVHLQEWKQRE